MKFLQPTVGMIRVGVARQDGVLVLDPPVRNTMTYEGIDLMARMLAWEDVRINTAYLEFINNITTPSVAVDPADGRSYYAELDEGGGVQSDYLRVPIVVRPALEASRAEFAGNRVVFSAFSSGASGVRGLTFDASSYVFGLALVWAPDATDRTQDVVFSRGYGFSPKQKSATHQINLQWSHTVGDIVS